MSLQSIISGPVGTAPAATLTKSVNLAPSTGGTSFVVQNFDSGRYLIKVLTSLVGSNAGPVSTSTYFSY